MRMVASARSIYIFNPSRKKSLSALFGELDMGPKMTEKKSLSALSGELHMGPEMTEEKSLHTGLMVSINLV